MLLIMGSLGNSRHRWLTDAEIPWEVCKYCGIRKRKAGRNGTMYMFPDGVITIGGSLYRPPPCPKSEDHEQGK